MQRRVRYRWAYAIPAPIVLALTAAITVATMVFTLMGQANMTRMRQYLNKTSQGRIFTTYLYVQKGETAAQAVPATRKPKRNSTRRWVENTGKYAVTVAERDNDSLIINGSGAPQALPLLQETPVTQREEVTLRDDGK